MTKPVEPNGSEPARRRFRISVGALHAYLSEYAAANNYDMPFNVDIVKAVDALEAEPVIAPQPDHVRDATEQMRNDEKVALQPTPEPRCTICGLPELPAHSAAATKRPQWHQFKAAPQGVGKLSHAFTFEELRQLFEQGIELADKACCREKLGTLLAVLEDCADV